MPTKSGTKNAMEKTGPINPTDWATASFNVSFFLPPSVFVPTSLTIESPDIEPPLH